MYTYIYIAIPLKPKKRRYRPITIQAPVGFHPHEIITTEHICNLSIDPASPSLLSIMRRVSQSIRWPLGF